jgi:hypothetical protein
MKIGLLSDTHGFIHPKVFEFFSDANEIWHAGDAGNIQLLDKLAKFKTLRAVFGNIDGPDIRIVHPEHHVFMCEQLKVFMIHIGGYPGRYQPKVRRIIEKEKPGLFISGHSHILKVMPDPKYDLLHINPGAAGKNGLHQVITMVKFTVEKDRVKDLDVLELPKWSQ